jgi:hypothetical protein
VPARRSLVVTLLTLMATACSSGMAPSPTDPHPFVAVTTATTSTTTTLSVTDAIVAYRECLADEGVSIGEITLDARGRPRMALALADLDLTDSATLAALETCAPILASGLLDLDADPELMSMVRADLESLAECIRDRGVPDFPDPVPDFDGVGPPFPVNLIPWADPALPDAMADCSLIDGDSR